MSLIKEYKGFNIESDDTFSLKYIKYPGRGSVPSLLRGAYTKTGLAENDIDIFLHSEGKHNAKTSISGRNK